MRLILIPVCLVEVAVERFVGLVMAGRIQVQFGGLGGAGKQGQGGEG